MWRIPKLPVPVPVAWIVVSLTGKITALERKIFNFILTFG